MSEADLERSRRQAEQTIVTAQAESQQRVLAGKGESQRLLQIGLKVIVPCRSPLQECFPQKAGDCEKDRRGKILSSPRAQRGEETE